MKKNLLIAGTVLALATGCEMKNPLLTESSAPFGAPEFVSHSLRNCNIEILQER